MEVHHILYKSHFGKSQRKLQEALSNKITVCKKCHDALHKGKLIVLYLKNDPELPIITTEKKKDSILDRVDRFIIGGVEYSCN